MLTSRTWEPPSRWLGGVLSALVAASVVTGCSTGMVAVVESEPGPGTWQLTYQNSGERPVSCRANVHYLSEDPSDDLDYGFRDATFTIEQEGQRVVDYPQPDLENLPDDLHGYGFRVLYRHYPGTDGSLYLTCHEVDAP